MSTGNIPSEKPPEFSASSQSDQSRISERVPDGFLDEMEKVVQAQSSHLNGGESNSNPINFTRAEKPLPTLESENVEKTNSLKERFVKALLSGNFKQAFSEIRNKVSVHDFIQWVRRVLPDANVSFRTFEGIVYPDEDVQEQISLDQYDAGAKILGQVDNFLIKGTLYQCKYSVVGDIDKLLKELSDVQDASAKSYRSFLKDFKKELEKESPSVDQLKQIASEHKDIVNALFPSSTLLATKEEFTEQFKVLVEGFCDVIEDNLESEGLFRQVGSILAQSVIITRFLDGDSKDDVFDEFCEVNHYCSGLKALFNQVNYLKEDGVLNDEDIQKMRGSLERVNEMLKGVELNSDKNLMVKENIRISAPELLRVLQPAGFSDF